jgi:hypothetical protein
MDAVKLQMTNYEKASYWRLLRRFSFVAAVLVFFSTSGQSQSASTVTSRWVWKERAIRNKPQTQFTINIARKGNIVTGVYSVDEFINGEWQGEDGNQTPFRGRIKDSTIRIEFDPMATAPGYEENVTYRPPTDQRKPSEAVLSLKGRQLLWRFVRGTGITNVPARVSLHREK